jgi:hypothetical protein
VAGELANADANIIDLLIMALRVIESTIHFVPCRVGVGSQKLRPDIQVDS